MRQSGFPLLLTATFIVFLFILTGCGSKSGSNEAVIEAMEESLENSTFSLKESSMHVLKSLYNKTNNIITREKASLWFPKAEQIQKSAVEIYTYIDELKTRLPLTAETADSLYKNLEKYRESILSTNASVRKEFSASFHIISKKFKADSSGQIRFYEKFFKKSGPQISKALLTSIQQNVIAFGYKATLFCNEQFTQHILIDDFPVLLISLNSKIVKPGETISINTGIGSFELQYKETVQINGVQAELNETGMATYNITAPAKPGVYKVPVEITFIDQDGHKTSLIKTVEYTVAKECGQ